MKSTVTVVLSATRAVAAVPGRVLADCAIDGGLPDALSAFFAQVRQASSSTDRLRVLLAPDLCELRVLKLPPMAREAALRALGRSATRHFLMASAPQVVDVARARQGTFSLALSAPAAVIECLEQAAAQSGFRIEGIGSCYEAWAAAHGKQADGWVLTELPETIELMRVRRGGLAQLRRFPGVRADLVEQVLLNEPDVNVSRLSDALTAAAQYHGALTLTLESDGRRARRNAMARRTTRLQWAAALVLLCSAVILERWGLQRELDHLQSLRRGLQTQAQTALSAWDSAQAALSTVSELARLESTRSDWSGLLLQVAEQLPEGARLLALQGQRDTMTLEISTSDAVAALEALKERPSFGQLQILGSIQRREQQDGSVAEHFVVAVPSELPRGKRK